MVQRRKEQQQDFEFFGTVHVGSKSYIIQPPTNTHDTHSLRYIEQDMPMGITFKVDTEKLLYRASIILKDLSSRDTGGKLQNMK